MGGESKETYKIGLKLGSQSGQIMFIDSNILILTIKNLF